MATVGQLMLVLVLVLVLVRPLAFLLGFVRGWFDGRRAPFVGPWYAVPCCSSCDEPLSRAEEFHSGGVCPRCGASTDGTIVDTVTKVFREERRERGGPVIYVERGKEQWPLN